MAAKGYPGTFPGELTTGYLNIGAVQKQRTNSKGYPGIFPGELTTGYMNIGAVEKDVTTTAVTRRRQYQSMGKYW